MPKLNEKNACPMAPKNTSAFTLLKSGFNKNSKPLLASGRDIEQTANTKMRINKTGISTLDDFSIPSFTPFTMTK